MDDRFNRHIDYLRLSVTDRCNLACWYCTAPEGSLRSFPCGLMTLDEIMQVAHAAAEMGFTKFRITGGEPLLRDDIVTLVEQLAAIETVRDLAMTTNAIRLPAMADKLVRAGLMRVNISIDTMDSTRFAEQTGGGSLEKVLKGIAAADRAGLQPIKLNCVVEKSADEEDARQVAAFAAQHGYQVRFIPRMDMQEGIFSVVQGGSGGDCRRCNRLRLTSDGHIRPCLFSDLSFDTRRLGAAEALRRAVEHKPQRGGRSQHGKMRGIGG